MRLIEERRGSQVTSYVYEPGSYVPLARIDARGDKLDDRQTESAYTVSQHRAANAEIWGQDTPDVSAQNLSQSARIYHFHTDPSGLPEELSDDGGLVRWRAAYRTWGNTQVENWGVVRADGSAVPQSDQLD